MTFQNSTLTLDALRDLVEQNNSFSQTDISDSLLINAVNRGLYEYQRVESRVYPERYRATHGSFSVSTSGYDLLTNITDLGSDVVGFEVYRDSILPKNRLFEYPIGSRQEGYYILGDGKLYLTRNETSTLYVVYMKAYQFIAAGSDTSTTTIPVDQNLNPAFEEFVESRFYNTKRMKGDRDEAKELFIEELEKYFQDTPARVNTMVSW